MERIPVVIIDKDNEFIESIKTLLKNIPDIEIIQTGNSLGDLEIILEGKIKAIVIVGLSYKIEDFEKLLTQYRSSLVFTRVIILVDEISTNLLKKAIALNVHDVLKFPFTYSEIKESIKRADDNFKGVISKNAAKPKEEPEKRGSKKITLFSTKGGSGKSFIATNLAVDLVNQGKKKVVLFDLNYQFGDVALMLNLYPKHTIYDIMSVVDQLDSEMLNSFLTTHSSGVKVLPAPIDPTKGEAITTKVTMKILDILSEISDFIVMDTPSTFSDNVLSLFEKTDYLCMVTSMDVPNIKNLKISLQVLEQLKFPEEKIFIILNRANSKVGITMDDVEKTIKKKIDVIIPSDKIVPLTINKGVPVVIEAPRCSVSHGIHRLAKLLLTVGEKSKR